MQTNQDLFFQHIAQTSDEPTGIEVVRGEGIYLYDPQGKAYIDFISGICVSNVGHSAPEVVAAIQAQSERYLHPMVYGEYFMAPQVQFAELLTSLLDDSLDTVYFTNSGTEAIEASLKLAKKTTGRTEIISFFNAYHGSTHGSLSVTGNPWMREGYGPFLPEVRHIPFNEPEAFAEITEKTAAVVVEMIQGAGGVVLPQPGFIPALKAHCEGTGTLLIVDEIQTGLGRSGAMFAHQTEGIVPDILVLAKALGGGLPIGAFIAPKARMQRLMRDPILGHITTFGGNPLCCAAGMAALKKTMAEGLIEAMPAKERLLREHLQHPAIVELRGRGLMFALILKDFDTINRVKKALLRRGLLTCFFLSHDHGLRLCPPLTITEEEIGVAVEIIKAALEEVCG